MTRPAYKKNISSINNTFEMTWNTFRTCLSSRFKAHCRSPTWVLKALFCTRDLSSVPSPRWELLRKQLDVFLNCHQLELEFRYRALRRWVTASRQAAFSQLLPSPRSQQLPKIWLSTVPNTSAQKRRSQSAVRISESRLPEKAGMTEHVRFSNYLPVFPP